MKTLGVIPARYSSTRFPGKPLAQIMGKPMLQYVYEAVSRSELVDEVVVATDDSRIVDAVAKFAGKAVLTSPDHATGTDRLTEVVFSIGEQFDTVINVQGDEPLIEEKVIDQCLEPFAQSPEAQDIVTVVHPIDDPEDLRNPNVVKVVTDNDGYAIYFSRSMIPFPFQFYKEEKDFSEALKFTVFYRHIGLYAYRKDFLMEFAEWKPTPLEMIESLEQLRILEHRRRVRVVESEYRSIGVDVPEDIEIVEEVLRKRWGIQG